MLAAFVDTYPSPVAGGCPLMNTAVDADDTNPELRALASDGIRAWKTRIVKIIHAGIERGEIKKGTPAARIANILVSTLEGALLISRLEGKREALQDAQFAINELLDGIANAGRKRPRLAPAPALR